MRIITNRAVSAWVQVAQATDEARRAKRKFAKWSPYK